MNFLSDAIPEAGGEVSGFCSDLCKPQGMFGELCGGCEPLGQIFDPCVDAAGQCCDSVGNCDLGVCMEAWDNSVRPAATVSVISLTDS